MKLSLDSNYYNRLYAVEQTIDQTKIIDAITIYGEKVRGRLVVEKEFTVILEDKNRDRHVIRKERLNMPIPPKHIRWYGKFDRLEVEKLKGRHSKGRRRAKMM